MNGDLLMFALESFHKSWQEKKSLTSAYIYTHWKNTKTVVSQAQRRYKKNIVWIKWVLIKDSTRRWILWSIDSSPSPHGFQQSLKDLRNKGLIFERNDLQTTSKRV